MSYRSTTARQAPAVDEQAQDAARQDLRIGRTA